MRHRAVITGLGVLSPVGNSVSEFFSNLVSGRSGIRMVPESRIVAGVVEFEPDDHFTKQELVGLDRFSQFALAATRQAVTDARLDARHLQGARVGVYFGSSIGGANAIQAGYEAFFKQGPRRVPPLTVIGTMANAAAAHISIQLGITGPVLTYSAACASSSLAIGEALRAIRDGYLDVAIAGGAEAVLNPGSIAAWSAMKVLAVPDTERPETSCRPFSKDRCGLVLGEGAGVIVIERLEHALSRRCSIHAELSGYGITSDASNIARPSCAGQVAALQSALADSGLSTSDIQYLNAHGTATVLGDAVETEAIKKVFGSHAYDFPVTSTKALHGHLLGAAGAVELIASVKSIMTRSIPPTSNYTAADPACDLDYAPNGARLNADIDAVMSSSFAFGGTNVVLVVRRY